MAGFARDPTCVLCQLLPFGACDRHRVQAEAEGQLDESSPHGETEMPLLPDHVREQAA